MNYHTFRDSNIEDVEGVAVAIKKLSPNQQHVGLLYKDPNFETKLLHQLKHYASLVSDPDNSYIWLEIPLDDANQVHMATICSLVAEENPDGIAFSICHQGTGFAKTGKFTSLEKYAGLTCATFVMQIFASQSLPIIDEDGWSHLPPDREWQNQIVQGMEQSGDKEFLAYQRKRILEGASRFLPEDVAAAAHLPNPPHGPEDVYDMSEMILDVIEQRYRGELA